MNLGLAGAISGAGEAGSKALTMAQAQWGAERLQTKRDEMDTLRQQRLMDHQAAQGELTRDASSKESQLTRDAAAANTDKTIDATGKLHDADNASRKGIADESNKTQIQIHDATNKVNERIAGLKHDLDKQTLKVSELSSVQKNIDSITDDLRGIEIELTKPLIDSESASVVALKAGLAAKKAQRDKLQAQFNARVADLQTKDGVKAPEAAVVVPSASGVSAWGPYGPPPSKTSTSAKAPGLVNTQLPSDAEQEMMRKAITR